jgi:hypothetical protein
MQVSFSSFRVLLIIVFITSLTSCTLMERRYRPGFYTGRPAMTSHHTGQSSRGEPAVSPVSATKKKRGSVREKAANNENSQEIKRSSGDGWGELIFYLFLLICIILWYLIYIALIALFPAMSVVLAECISAGIVLAGVIALIVWIVNLP